MANNQAATTKQQQTTPMPHLSPREKQQQQQQAHPQKHPITAPPITSTVPLKQIAPTTQMQQPQGNHQQQQTPSSAPQTTCGSLQEKPTSPSPAAKAPESTSNPRPSVITELKTNSTVPANCKNSANVQSVNIPDEQSQDDCQGVKEPQSNVTTEQLRQLRRPPRAASGKFFL